MGLPGPGVSLNDRRSSDEREQLWREHSPEVIGARLAAGPRRSHLRDLVYGAVDGTVTTFAVVAGVAGARLASSIVLILGAANLLADGFSMAASNFTSCRAENQRRERLRRQERRHIALVPDGEREEVRQLLSRMGLEGEALDHAVMAATADEERWINLMLQEEYGFAAEPHDPVRAAFATFGAFIVAGLIPLGAFVLDALPGVDLASPFAWSAALTGATFWVIGLAKGAVVDEARWRSGLEVLVIGGTAAALAFVAGVGLGSLA